MKVTMKKKTSQLTYFSQHLFTVFRQHLYSILYKIKDRKNKDKKYKVTIIRTISCITFFVGETKLGAC